MQGQQDGQHTFYIAALCDDITSVWFPYDHDYDVIK